MIIAVLGWLVACDGGKSDSAGGSSTDDSATDDSATDDSATNKDDSGTDDSGTDDSGCAKLDWYQDVDLDGYGAGPATSACESPGTGWVDNDADCDDALPEVNPDATEICNSIDDDCDKATDDEDDGVVGITWYEDGDGDGYGDPKGKSFVACTGAGGYAPDDAKHPPDCNDADAGVYPGAPELCDDFQTDCNIKGWAGDEGVATFYPASGGYEDWTADMTGKPGAAAKVDITDDGELVICDGTWYTAINVTSAFDVTIRSLHGAETTIISGGDDARPIGVFQDDATVTVEGLTLTEGNACYGAAVGTLIVSSCSSMGAGGSYTNGVTLNLVNNRIVDNAPTLIALSAIYVGYGNYLNLEGTTIANNSVQGFSAVNNPVGCSGSEKTDAGIWGNSGSAGFMWSIVIHGSDPYTFESTGCDFDGSGGTYTPAYDLSMQNFAGDYETFDFGDDAYFICDATTVACAK